MAVNKLNEQFKEGCYLVPSSIHEMVAIDRRDADAAGLIEMIHSTDCRVVNKEDILSDSLFFLDHTGLRRYSDA